MTEQEITIYEPNKAVKQSLIVTLREMFLELKESKWVMWQLFLRDFKGGYRQSFLGMGWAIILPLVTLGTFILLNSSGLFNVGNIEVPYAIYVILGLAFWQLFAVGLPRSTTSLTLSGGLIKNVNISKEAIVFSSLGFTFITFILQMAVVLVISIIYGFIPNWKFVFFPLLMIPILLITFGLGLIFSIINSVVRDIGNIIPIGITFLLFLTPIAYEIPNVGFISTLANYNPIYYLVVAPRDLALTGELTNPAAFFISTIIAIFIFFFCWIAFHITETRIAERV